MIANGLKNLHQLAVDDGVKLNLKEFVCGRSRQEVGGTKALAEAFSLMGTLELIELPQNGILVEGLLLNYGRMPLRNLVSSSRGYNFARGQTGY